MNVVTIAKAQWTRLMVMTNRMKSPVSFQLIHRTLGTVTKVTTPNRQPMLCHFTMPKTTMRGGNTISWNAVKITPVATNTCPNDKTQLESKRGREHQFQRGR